MRADAVARDHELRAAGLRDGRGHGRTAVQLLPDGGCEVFLLHLAAGVELGLRPVQVQPVRTPGLLVAAAVEVADAGDVRVAEMADRIRGVGVEQVVVVPGRQVRVEEDGRVGQVVVVVDDVGQVDHGFVAFVDRVLADDVDGRLDVWEVAGDPADVFVGEAADDERARVVEAGGFGLSR